MLLDNIESVSIHFRRSGSECHHLFAALWLWVSYVWSLFWPTVQEFPDPSSACWWCNTSSTAEGAVWVWDYISSTVHCFLRWGRWGLHMELELFWASGERLKLLYWQVGRGRVTKGNKVKASETVEDWFNTDLCCVSCGIPDVGTCRPKVASLYTVAVVGWSTNIASMMKMLK